VKSDLSSPGCGPGTCGEEWGARRNCVIFAGVAFGTLFDADNVPIASSFALIDRGERGGMATGAAGGVGG